MWIDDQIWTDAFLGEWHILLPVRHSNRALLPMSRCKLVADLWNSNGSHLYLGKAITILVSCQDHLIYHAFL